MIVDTLLFILIFFLIIIAFVGFGLFFSKYFLNIRKPHENLNLGIIGILGLILVTSISYLTSFFFIHNYLHNVLLISSGLLFFQIYYLKNDYKFKKEFLSLFFFSLFYISALFISKNHDDFSYYHLPFALSLVENKTIFGMGNLNLGYRHHSSLLYLNSILYLPYIKYFLFHSTNLIIFIFVNFYLLKNILINYKKKINLIFLFNLLFFILINLKFTRIAEYGTDIAGQLLLIIFFNLLIKVINLDIKFNRYNKDSYLILIIFIFLITLKVYFTIYGIFLLLIYKNYFHLFQKKFYLLKVISFLFIFFLLFIILNLANTGCVIYPIPDLCFPNQFFWGLPIEEVARLQFHLESWAKAGKIPGFSLSDLELYIANFNWVLNWIDLYFFTKMSDFLLTIISIVIVIIFSLKIKFKIDINKKNFLFLVLIGLVILEWFSKHPSLRYGGYFPIAFFIFFLFSSIVDYKSFDLLIKKSFLRKVIFLFIVFPILFFNIKNIHRIQKELNRSDMYKFTSFPYMHIERKKFEPLFDNNKIYLYKTIGHCWATPTPCAGTDSIGHKTKYGFKIFFLK